MWRLAPEFSGQRRPTLRSLPSAHPASPDQFAPDEFCPRVEAAAPAGYGRTRAVLALVPAPEATGPRASRPGPPLPSVASRHCQQEAPIAA
jgi:hypothetical protein